MSANDDTSAYRPPPAFVDWLLAALVALCGLSVIATGSALALFVDREALATAIEEESITVTVGTTELTDEEAVLVAETAIAWTGTGLLAVGAVTILFGLGFLVFRHRQRRRSQADGTSSAYWTYALLGGVITAAFSFVPFSPALGGAVAGYLEHDERHRSVSAGALAGLLPLLPIIGFLIVAIGGLMDGLLTIGESSMAMVVAVMMLISLLFLVIYTVGLGAVGGYIGGHVADRR